MSNNPETAKVAKANSWKALEMPDEFASLSISKTYTAKEFSILSCGLIPREMEDKWFIFMKDKMLFFHRSWTGICIYQATFEARGKEYVLQQAIVNQNQEQYSANDFNYEAALLSWLIDGLLLRKKVVFPLKQNLPKDTPAGLYQHHIAGTAFPETEVAEDSED